MHLHRVKPWDVNLAHILGELLHEMKGRGYVDFSVSGTALLSSAILLRMKSELVLKMEEPPKPSPERPVDFVPPPLALPLRYEYTTTSLDEILRGLLDVLKAERMLPPGIKLASHTPEVFEQADDFLVHIEENIEALLAVLVKQTKPGRRLSFLRLLGHGNHVEAVRIFILLLFLAVEGKVRMFQDQEFGDIEIELSTSGNANID